MIYYPKEFPDYFRVVDLRNGKKIDDGYRAVHLYYQRDNLAYPIEIQLWCGEDYFFYIWSHRYIYKYKGPEIGKILYEEYAPYSYVEDMKQFIDMVSQMNRAA